MDKTILITGAGSGMGRAIALHYAGLNAKLSIADIDAKSLQETAENCMKTNNENIMQTVVDMSIDEDVKHLVNNTITKFGKIDILVNCAGILKATSLFDPDLMKVYDKILAVNLRSVVLLTSLCAPHLIQTKGCVINIASIASILTIRNGLAYNVSKAGVDHFTRCAALELADHGVRVNAILPGVVSSKLYINGGMTEDQNEHFSKAIEAMTPLKHVIGCDEIVDLVEFLASEKARSMTGGSYLIDAGTVLSEYNPKF